MNQEDKVSNFLSWLKENDLFLSFRTKNKSTLIIKELEDLKFIEDFFESEGLIDKLSDQLSLKIELF